jgi:hypothetical protein
MHLGIAASDRKILLIGGGLLLLLLTVTILLSPSGDERDSYYPSTYSAQSSGALAAYDLLAKFHYPVRRWEDPPTELPQQSNGILLILANPFLPPSEKERKALASFVEDGGHVLITGSAIPMFFKDAVISPSRPNATWTSFYPTLPSPVTRGAEHIILQPQASWGTLNESQIPLYAEKDSVAVVSWYVGKGRILWWAGPTPLTNAGISREQNLNLFLNSVARWSAHGPYQIYWDEYFHGERGSLWAYVQKTPVPWGLVQLMLLGLAVLFTFGRRSGPIVVPTQVSRLSPLEFVDTLGGLYQRARASPAAVAIIYQQLRRTLKLKWALSANASAALVEENASQRLGWRESGIAATLERARTASEARKLAPSDALEIIRELEDLEGKLGLKPTKFQENN